MHCDPNSDDNLCDALITLGFDVLILIITVVITAIIKYYRKQNSSKFEQTSSLYQMSPKSQSSFLFKISNQEA